MGASQKRGGGLGTLRICREFNGIMGGVLIGGDFVRIVVRNSHINERIAGKELITAKFRGIVDKREETRSKISRNMGNRL